MNIIVTGYYFEKNLGDDLFEKIGKEIFTEKNFKQKINKIEFMKIDKINSNLDDINSSFKNNFGDINFSKIKI